MRAYIQRNLTIFLLCLGSAVGLIVNVFQAFLIPDKQSSNYLLMIFMAAVFLLLFFAGTYNKKTLWISLSVFLLVLLAGIFYIREAPGFSFAAHLFEILTFFFCGIIFLLSRTIAGTAVLFFLGSGLFSLIALFQYNNVLWGFLVFLLTASCLFFVRKFSGEGCTRRNNLSIFLVFVSVCACALLLSVAAYFFCIRPLNLPTQETAVLTQLKSMDIVRRAGLYSQVHLYNDRLQTQNTTDQSRVLPDDPTPAKTQVTSAAEKQMPDTREEYVPSPKNERSFFTQAITYSEESSWLVLTIGVLLGTASLLGLMKILRRKMWLKKVLQKDEKQQIFIFYQYFLCGFQKIGYPRRAGDTLWEYVKKVELQIIPFEVNGIGFSALTDIYIKTLYGNQPVVPDQNTAFLEFYKIFLRQCRKKLGFLKYHWKFLFI